ncbi:FkbM family methyltransferase [Pedobacter sp. PF22-3]|uniref:FkbM family methyltransferase n=1 Tax=Pedobacter sp. PF22-3 TaxID=2994467 RepID=UPI002245B18E|nr:FkbM family methyltransferase [Pedobacter sp. PF22-3]MCX2492585.1 FkbM family methyltransferase [Pedobacter sp. PF22-3]
MTKVNDSLFFRLKRYFKHYGRKTKLNGTAASKLSIGELDSLELLEICKKSEYPIQTIYDIGAHVGIWTVLTKSIFPSSKIVCFEPLAQHHVTLKANTSHLNNINIYPFALGPKTGEATINIANRSDSSSIMDLTTKQAEIFGVTMDRTGSIQIAQLDEFIRKEQIQLPDLMKLDIQGYELEALKGGIACMQACKFIILEVSFLEFYQGQPLFEEVIAFMASHQYKTIAFGYNTATGSRIEQCDILFENTKL